jgi:hypothetical protein
MARLTKETRVKIEKYLLNAIDNNDYSQMEQINTKKDALIFLYKTFKANYGHEIKRIGQYKAFSEWLRGLPSVCNIEFMNYKILELAKEWGQDVTTEKQQDKIIYSYWDFITWQYFKLFKNYKIEVV